MSERYLDIEHRNNRWTNWVGAFLIVIFIIIAFDYAGGVDFEALEREHAEKIRHHSIATSLGNGWHLCPPPEPGMTDTLVMVISTTADEQPTVTSCARIAERQYQPRRRMPEVAAQ